MGAQRAGLPRGRYLVVPGAGSEELGRLQGGSGHRPPASLTDLLGHELGGKILHDGSSERHQHYGALTSFDRSAPMGSCLFLPKSRGLAEAAR